VWGTRKGIQLAGFLSFFVEGSDMEAQHPNSEYQHGEISTALKEGPLGACLELYLGSCDHCWQRTSFQKDDSCPISRQLTSPQSSGQPTWTDGRETIPIMIYKQKCLGDPGHLPILLLGTPAGR
jgi:hypothetical protein